MLKVFQADQTFVYARLRELEALPSERMLVGVVLGDAAYQKEISVAGWRLRPRPMDFAAVHR